MAQNITPLIVGNWKMNGLGASLVEVEALSNMLIEHPPRCTVAVCPPATLVERVARLAAPAGVLVGGQDCHTEQAGAHTGDVSAAMLRDGGAQLVIVGHSERRTDHGETDDIVRAKAAAALAAGLMPIVCVGETRTQREAGEAISVVSGQVAASLPDTDDPAGRLVIAYEPVWAIGTGLTPTAHNIAEMHECLRNLMVSRFGAGGEGVRLLYGGSLKPSNAAEILAVPHVNGGLVGGASLNAADFFAIISAA